MRLAIRLAISQTNIPFTCEMTFDLKRMLESKEAPRRKLAGRPLAEKLAMLDALRERSLALREAGDHLRHSAVHEVPNILQHLGARSIMLDFRERV